MGHGFQPLIKKIQIRLNQVWSLPHPPVFLLHVFLLGSSGLNGSITLKLRAPKEGEGPGYDALYNLLGQYETETEDLGLVRESLYHSIVNIFIVSRTRSLPGRL